MNIYVLNNVWNRLGNVCELCLGVYPTKEKAQEAMKRAVEKNKYEWIATRNLLIEKDFKVEERKRTSAITSLINNDWERFIIDEVPIDDISEFTKENA